MRANISDLWILLVNARIRGFIFDCVPFFPLLYSSSSSFLFFATEIFRFLVARVKNSIRDFKFYLEESSCCKVICRLASGRPLAVLKF